MATYTSPTTTVTVASSSSGGGTPVASTYDYPLNTAWVRVVRPVSDVLRRVKVAMRDTDNKRWSDAEIYNAINRSLDTWANRVYVPCVYDMPQDLTWDTDDYPLPYYLREPFVLQRKTERWYWAGVDTDDGWSDVQGAYTTSDGKGGQYLHVEVGTNWLTTEDARILWHAEVGHVPTEDVYLSAELSDSDATMTISSLIMHTIGDVGYVLVDQELIQYSGVSESATSTTLHNLVRGSNGTSIVTHATGAQAEWCIPYVDSSLYNVLQDQIMSYLQLFYMTDSSARETEHHQWMLRWEQQIADDFWATWLPNRKPKVHLSRTAINDRRY